MKRTTIYLDPELEVLLKLEATRRNQPMAELVREALRAHLAERRAGPPPGAGAFDSGHDDTAERFEEILGEVGFGEDEADRKLGQNSPSGVEGKLDGDTKDA